MNRQQKSAFYGSLILEKKLEKTISEKFQIASSVLSQNEKRPLTA